MNLNKFLLYLVFLTIVKTQSIIPAPMITTNTTSDEHEWADFRRAIIIDDNLLLRAKTLNYPFTFEIISINSSDTISFTAEPSNLESDEELNDLVNNGILFFGIDPKLSLIKKRYQGGINDKTLYFSFEYCLTGSNGYCDQNSMRTMITKVNFNYSPQNSEPLSFFNYQDTKRIKLSGNDLRVNMVVTNWDSTRIYFHNTIFQNWVTKGLSIVEVTDSIFINATPRHVYNNSFSGNMVFSEIVYQTSMKFRNDGENQSYFSYDTLQIFNNNTLEVDSETFVLDLSQDDDSAIIHYVPDNDMDGDIVNPRGIWKKDWNSVFVIREAVAIGTNQNWEDENTGFYIEERGYDYWNGIGSPSNSLEIFPSVNFEANYDTRWGNGAQSLTEPWINSPSLLFAGYGYANGGGNPGLFFTKISNNMEISYHYEWLHNNDPATGSIEIWDIHENKNGKLIMVGRWWRGGQEEFVFITNTIPPELSDIVPGYNEITLQEDGSAIVQLNSESPHNSSLSFSVTSYPTDLNASISITGEGEFLSIDPILNWNGSGSLTVIVTDENGLADTASVVVHVQPVNDAPVFPEMSDLVVDEDNTIGIQLLATDLDGDFLTYYVDPIDFVDLYVYNNQNIDSLLMVPEPDYNGTITVNLTVEDEYGLSVETSFMLTVNPVDDEPFVDNYIEDQYFYEDFQEVWESDLAQVFTDIDGDLTYSIVLSDPTVISAEMNDNLLVLSSIPDAEGQTIMDLTASNPLRASVTTSVMVTVFGENDAPILADMEPLVMTEDITYEFMSMASLVEAGHISDVDNTLEELTFHLHSETDHVYVEWDGDANSTPMIHTEPDYYGPGSLVLCASDEYEERCTTIGLNVDPVNDAPYFASEMHAPVGVDMEFHLPLYVMDVDSEELVVTLNELESNPAWVTVTDHTLHGTPDMLGEYPVHLSLTDGQETTLGTFVLHVVNFKPEIVAIEDIPNDQGGRVYVGFQGSFMDNGMETGQSYSVFRWDIIGEEEGWVGVQSLDAVGDPNYIYEVSTVHDSTEGNSALTQFKVVANMNNGIFHSDPMMGYSVDNIAPGVPGGLMAVAMDDNIHLSWNMSTEEDFQYFVLEKATNMDFTEPEVIQTADTSYTDVNFTANETNYYRLVVIDHAGNISDYSAVVEAAVLSIDENMVPAVFALHQNYPNPFNPTTQIKYDIAEDSFVRITIFDVMGRNIRTLMNVNQNAGYHSIHWDAKNDMGEGVSAGMYIYVIQAGEFRATKKMVLLK